MEAEDKVTSELNCFSKKSKCVADKEGKTKMCTSRKDIVMTCNDDTLQNFSDVNDSEDLPYTCLLGSNGQVILWNPDSETVLSRFEFSYPNQLINKGSVVSLTTEVNENGDLAANKNNLQKEEGVILIEHQNATTLDLVGEQVWRGALFLADFILHNVEIFNNACVLEVASGVGLTSIVAAMHAKKVITTDVNKGDIIHLISNNIKRNKHVIKANINVKEIDFFDLRTIDELGKQMDDVNILLAADVVYHNQLTDAFISAVQYIMMKQPDKVMFIALEKRYVFTIEDMDTVAPCYEYFVSKLEWLKQQETNEMEWSIEQLSSDFPQYFTYERTPHLVLWRIKAMAK